MYYTVHSVYFQILKGIHLQIHMDFVSPSYIFFVQTKEENGKS